MNSMWEVGKGTVSRMIPGFLKFPGDDAPLSVIKKDRGVPSERGMYRFRRVH